MPATLTFPPALRVWLCVLAALILLGEPLCARQSASRKSPERLRSTTLFDRAATLGPIYYPSGAAPDAPERRAAQALGAYLEKMSGQRWEVLPEPPALLSNGIFIGRTRRAFADNLWRANDPHAPLRLPTDRINYAITPRRVAIVGENPQATLAGVYRFLHTYGGARWYAPGSIGEEIPSLSRLDLPQKRGHWQPSFLNRHFYAAAQHKDFRAWAEKMGNNSHITINHNLHRTFTPELYARHPEYWASVDGTRRPPVKGGRSAQLDYTHPDVARLSTEAARKGLDAPHRPLSFSLGINDTIDFGDDEATQAAIAPLRYWRGHPVFSDLIFTFSNAVAREVAQTHPDRLLTVLAYMWAEQVPQFPLEPNLMPWLCIDHAQWYDPERRSSDKELTRRWARSGAQELGVWEYYQGSGFFIPRIFNHLTAESLKFLHAEGFRSLFFESGTIPGFDAPKMWLATQLAWNIDADPAAIMHDFYYGYYGAAAPFMQELFEYCEQLWMEQAGQAYWLKYFLNINQAALYPPQALEKINSLLTAAQAALNNADAPQRYHQRLRQSADAFAYLEAAARYYHSYAELLTMPLHTAADASLFSERAKAFAQARKALEGAPQLTLASPWEMRPQLLQLRPETRLEAAAFKQPELLPAAATGRILLREDFSNTIAEADAEAEGGFAPQRSLTTALASGWNLRWTHHEGARMTRQRDDGGQWRLTLVNQEFFSLFRWLKVPQQAAQTGVRLEVRGDIDPGCQLRLALSWMDATHKPLGQNVYNILPPGNYTNWHDLAVTAPRPDGAAWLYVGIRLQNQADGSPLSLRDWEVFVY